MKRGVAWIFLIILLVTLVAPLASASIFSWLGDLLGITGKATTNETAVTTITEQIKCVFVDSNEIQKCYTDDGKFSCEGIGSCIAEVSGTQGASLRWKSSCGGEYLTTIDGVNDEIAFKCPVLITTPAVVCGNGACEASETCSLCSQDCGTCIKEQIKCNFINSNSEQKCYTSDGKFSCSGIESCLATVEETIGKQLEWKSSCGGLVYTKVDGVNEDATFQCGTVTVIMPPCGNGICESGETYYSCNADCASSYMKEQVKCVFWNSNSYQQCYTDDGKFGCSGIGSCIADVIGNQGEQKTWKSSCGGYAYTKIDGNNEYAEFKCEAIQPTTTTPVPVEVVKEQVKCIFGNSNSAQECYSEGYKCSGIGTCIADVSGEKGKQLTWKSSCGGYAYTVMDGANDYAEFKCGEPVAVQQPIAPTSKIEKKALLYIVIQDGCRPCDDIKKFIDELKQKYADVNVNYLPLPATSTPTQAYVNLVVVAYIKRGVPTTFLDNRVWNGFNDDIAAEIESKVKACLEQGCRVDPNPPIPDELKMYLSSFMTVAPKITTAQAPIREGYVKEQVRCIFHNSDVLYNPHTARPEKCLTDDGNFGCVWDGNVMVEEDGKRKAYCVATVDGAIGTKLTWKSSCGGYAYSVINGGEEDVDFSCIPATNVTVEQIGGKGFAYAYWQCYDGLEFKQATGNCKTSEVWQKEAQEFCKYNCKKIEMAHPHQKCPLGLSRDMPVGKVIVNEKEYTFELISNPSNTSAILKIINPDGATIQRKFEMEAREKVFDTLTIILGSSYPGRTDVLVEGGDNYVDCMKCGVNSFAVSGECYLEAGKEGVVFIPTIEEAKGIEAKEVKEVKIEEALICKDSCPFNNKCYPFGYRKADRYCSDNNVFVTQLKSQEACDNSFECKSNVCIAGECVSENLIHKIMNWFKKLFGLLGREEETEESIDCGASSECMENAFKVCKPAKISQSGSVSEIVGLKDEKCVLKVTAGEESMTCKIENYALGTKNLGNIEQYCKGDLVKKLAAEKKIQSLSTEKVIHKEVEVPAQIEALDAMSACEKIKNPDFKYECTAMLKKDPSDCAMVNEPARPYCYADVALATGDSGICGKIKDSSHKEACKALVEKAPAKCSGWIYADYCYRDVAALIGDTSVCDYIKYEGGKVDCKAVILRDATICQNSDNEDCYQKLALLTGDEKVCDELKKRGDVKEGESVEEGGIRKIYNLDLEVSKCIKMAKREVIGCLFKSGSGTDCDLIPAFAKNPSLCENLKSDYEGFAERDLCYFYAVMGAADLLPPQLIVL